MTTSSSPPPQLDPLRAGRPLSRRLAYTASAGSIATRAPVRARTRFAARAWLRFVIRILATPSFASSFRSSSLGWTGSMQRLPPRERPGRRGSRSHEARRTSPTSRSWKGLHACAESTSLPALRFIKSAVGRTLGICLSHCRVVEGNGTLEAAGGFEQAATREVAP